MVVVLYSEKEIASKCIAHQLIDLINPEKIEENVFLYKGHYICKVDVDKMYKIYSPIEVKDYAIILSPHKSKTGKPSLTVHTPGNWNEADFGGKPYTLNYGNGSLMWSLLRNLNNMNDINYNVSYEVDHHGPTVDYPITFIEVGSTKKEWNNVKACNIVAKSVLDILDNGFKQVDNWIGIGGGHYAPTFTRKSLNEEIGFPHMAPKYRLLNKDLLIQSLEKSAQNVKGFCLDKKGLGKNKHELLDLLSTIRAEVIYC